MNRRLYYIDRVLFEIVKVTAGRELSFLGVGNQIRCIKAHSISFLKSNLNWSGFYRLSLNMYYSLARLNGMPMFSFDMNRRKEQYKEFNEKFNDYVVGYDLGLDFDENCIYDRDSKHRWCDKLGISIAGKYTNTCPKCPHYKSNYSTLYEEASILKEYFDKFKVPYGVRMSGSGIHFTVNHEYLPKDVDGVKFCNQFCEGLKTIFNFTTLDQSIYDWRRIWKVPYSIDIKTGNVCLPLSDWQFEHLSQDAEFLKPEKVLITVKNRGLLERKGTKENFNQFCEEYIKKW